MTKRRSPKLYRPRRNRVECYEPVVDRIPWELYEALRQQHEALLDWVAQLESAVADPSMQPLPVPAAAIDPQIQRLRTENQDLRDRLDRQQHTIVQLKRALEYSLDGLVPVELLASLQLIPSAEATASTSRIAPAPEPSVPATPEPAIAASASSTANIRKSFASVQLPRFR